MKSKKKYIVFASLVLALSAAVYINWQLSGAKLLKVPKNSERHHMSVQPLRRRMMRYSRRRHFQTRAKAIFQPKGQSGRQLRIK